MYLTFAWRYLIAKKTTNAINIIAWISILAIAVGTAALVLVLSVFNGFEGLVKSLYSTFYTDLKVLPEKGKMITVTPKQIEQMKGLEGVSYFSYVMEEKALLQNGEFQTIVVLKGVDENYPRVAGLASAVKKGKYELGTVDNPLAILGSGIEYAVGVEADQNFMPLTVYLPRPGAGVSSNPLDALNAGNINTSGTFYIQQDFDNKYVITNIEFVKLMLNSAGNEYSGIEIAVKKGFEAEEVQKGLKKIFSTGYKVQTRYEQNQSLYSVMQIEKWVIFGILALVLCVAAFNMVGALTMLVLEKEKDINVLMSVGADQSYIRKIFITEGILLSTLGGIIGIIIALAFTFLQIKYKLIPLEGGTFVIDYYPITIVAADLIAIAGVVLFIGILASWIPAAKAARQKFSLREE